MEEPPRVLLAPGMTEADYFRLRDRWYRRLEKEGVPSDDRHGGGRSGDPPKARNREVNVRAPDPSYTERLEQIEAKRAFYARRQQFLESSSRHRPRGRERKVWRLHCDGVPNRHIAKALGVGRSTVQRDMERLTARFEEWWERAARTREAEEERRMREGSE